jgi:YaiO family outer membrane protein
MDFEENDVDILSAGGAHYLGNWYLRAVTFLSTLAGNSALSFSGTARRYIDPPREYVEIGAGTGREVVVLGPGPTVDTRDTRFFQIRVQRFLAYRWGFSAAAMVNRFEGAPERRGFSLGLMARF